MVCGKHLQVKYVRWLIKYHLPIFFVIILFTTLAFPLFFFRIDRQLWKDLLRGFQAHGTKTSDDYRKLIALFRETQTNHLYPHSTSSKAFHKIPYGSYQPQINPCSKRFYLPSCPIIHYMEFTFAFRNQSHTLIDELQILCRFESNLRQRYSSTHNQKNRSTTTKNSCQMIGPINLLLNDSLVTSCEEISETKWQFFSKQWLACHTSSCSNDALKRYLQISPGAHQFQIYVSLDGDDGDDEYRRRNLIDLYHQLNEWRLGKDFYLMDYQITGENESILFYYLLQLNLPSCSLTIFIYFVCLLVFVKNIFFLFIFLLHLIHSFVLTSIIYISLFHFPLTILNITSGTLGLFILLLDAFLWYTCWFINDHRPNDCTIHRKIENLLTQTFYYLLPKNLIAILILIITATNQIIALQSFTIYSVIFIFISSIISLFIYPVSFICILRYQSYLPTCEQIFKRSINCSCLFDRTIPCLVVRFKAFWLMILTILTAFSFFILFYWPTLSYNLCRITFQSLPRFSSEICPKTSIDFDVTYYIGSHWEMPNESLIPSSDIPILEYNAENKMSVSPGHFVTFADLFETNLSQWIDFCSQSSQQHHHQNQTESSSFLSLRSFDCFGEISSTSFSPTFSSESKFLPIIRQHLNRSDDDDCSIICSLNQTSSTYSCLLCLNDKFYSSKSIDDYFILKNGLRFLHDASNPRYLLQTITYQWNQSESFSSSQWQLLLRILRTDTWTKTLWKLFPQMSIWWSSEIFATFTIIEQLEQEKYCLMAIKFILLGMFLLLFAGLLGLFATVTILCNFLLIIAVLTLLHFEITVEHISYFTVVMIIASQYSILYSMSYKLAPAFFYQRENRTLYSLKQLSSTLCFMTLSIFMTSIPCLFSSLPYIFKSAQIFCFASIMSFISSTFFLESFFCLFGPSEHPCCLKISRHSRRARSKSVDLSSRPSSNLTRRKQRMSTSSYFASSHFSQMFTGSTYFESDYSNINEFLALNSRRRESSRSHQTAYAIKRTSVFAGEVIELYTPRASLAPYPYHHHPRYSRHSSVSRVSGVPTTGPVRPLYISPSVSPHSQLSIHSQSINTGRQRSLSPQPRSPSPRSLTKQQTISNLRPCYSAPRLNRIQASKTLPEEPVRSLGKPLVIIQRQDAISSHDEFECLSAEERRNLLKSTTIETGSSVWLKRSNSS